MLRRYVSLFVVLTAFTLTFTLPGFAAVNPSNARHDYVPDWSYQGYNGPAYWASLNPVYEACTNQHQSPISLPSSPKDTSVLPLTFHYQSGPFDEYLDNHNLYTYQEGKSNVESVNFAGQHYRLLEVHFHNPAEHQLGQETFPLEAHIVHDTPNGNLLAIGVWIVPGPANPFIAQLLTKPTPKLFARDLEPLAVDPMTLLPSNRSFYSYSGSLTTPPCGDVQWIVMRNTITASPEQIAQLKTLLGQNARPIQERHDRKINWVPSTSLL